MSASVELAPFSSSTMQPSSSFPSDKKDSLAAFGGQHTPQELSREAEHDGSGSEGGKESTDGKRQDRIPTLALPSLYLAMIMAGINDSSQGPLILRIQSWYGVSYTVVSLIFIFGFLGFFTAAVINVWMTDRYGFGKVLAFAASCQVVSYSLILWAPPFPVLCLAFAINGVGMGLQDAQANSFVAKMENSSPKMSMLHAVYADPHKMIVVVGVGALTAPLIATQFAKMPHWSYHYAISLGVAVADLASQILVFKFKREEYFFGLDVNGNAESFDQSSREGKRGSDANSTPIDTNDIALRSIIPAENEAQFVSEITHSSSSKMSAILKSPTVQLLAFFALIYVGLEVSIGGWLVAYLQTVRGGGPDSGYASTGFFGGLTLGRLLAIPMHKYVDENRALFVYAILAMGLELTVWLVPSLVGNAVASAFIGVFLGPFYPVMMNLTAAAVPRHLAGGAIGWIASLGQAGSAAFPFATGAMANKYGLWVLQPLLLAMIVAMSVIWASVLWLARADLKVAREANKALKEQKKAGGL